MANILKLGDIILGKSIKIRYKVTSVSNTGAIRAIALDGRLKGEKFFIIQPGNFEIIGNELQLAFEKDLKKELK